MASLASSAAAQDYPVSTNAQLTAALASAQASAAADRIVLAAGAYAGAFAYTGASALEIIGAGTGQTTITAPANGQPALTLNGQATVRALTAATAAGAGQRAIRLDGGTAEGVTVTVAPGASASFGVTGTGGALRASTVTVPAGSAAIEITGGTLALADTTLAGGGIAAAAAGAQIVADRIRVQGGATAIHALLGGTVTLRDSLVTVAAGQTALLADDGGNAGSFASTIVATRVTLAGSGAGARGAVATTGGAGDAMAVTITDSVLTGLDVPLRCTENGGQGTIAVTRVSLPATGSLDQCGGGITIAAPVSGTPTFANAAAGDYHPRFGSPMIDAGDPAAALPASDIDGLARAVDGNGDGTVRHDLGAFEYQRRAPTVTATATPSGATVGTAVTVTAVGADADPGDTLAYAWAFDDGQSASGATVTHAFTRDGSHTATVTVTDPAGLKGTATATIAVGDVTGTAAGSQGRPRLLSLSWSRRADGTLRISWAASRKATGRWTLTRLVPQRGRRLAHWERLPGSVSIAVKPGRGRHVFAGILAGKRLPPGSYRLTMRLRDPATGALSNTRRIAIRLLPKR